MKNVDKKQVILMQRDRHLIKLHREQKWSVVDLAAYFNITRQMVHLIIKKHGK